MSTRGAQAKEVGRFIWTVLTGTPDELKGKAREAYEDVKRQIDERRAARAPSTRPTLNGQAASEERPPPPRRAPAPSTAAGIPCWCPEHPAPHYHAPPAAAADEEPRR